MRIAAPGIIVTRALIGLLLGLAVLVACSDGADSEDSSSTSSSGDANAAVDPRAADELRLNQLQMIGTHNSFHVPAPAEEYELLAALSAEQAAQRVYGHLPITAQLADQQVRQFEFDVFVDTKGGLYADPALRRQAGLGPIDDPAMLQPGIKVLHEQDVDYHSVCATLVACLTEVADWSEANPSHVPIAINIQFKDGPLVFNVADQAVPEKWTAEQMDALEAEILSVFEPEQIITPDDVRGEKATLEEAVLDGDWPTLGDSRGKVMFLMINGDDYRTTYLTGHPNLEGRLLFTNSEPGQPDAAYIGVDNPLETPGRIEGLVELGYMVRTRADEPDNQARLNDTVTRDAAFDSGAHWISTDHPAGDSAYDLYGTNYVVEFPDSLPARCNPITAPEDCDDGTIEP